VFLNTHGYGLRIENSMGTIEGLIKTHRYCWRIEKTH